MRFIINLFLSVAFSGIAIAQETTITPVMRYDDSPAAIYTGVPDIKVPFVTLPTRSKDISANIGLQYNPLNGVAATTNAGICGFGWNIMDGEGVVEGPLVIKEFNNGLFDNEYPVYNFSFMGYTGKFKLRKILHSDLIPFSIKQGAQQTKLHLNFDYTTVLNTTNNPPNLYSTTTITSFSLSDQRGYKYIFSSTGKLLTIVDESNNELLSFTYDSGGFISEIISAGYGKVSFTYSGTGAGKRLIEMRLFDTSAIAVKKMKLTHDSTTLKSAQISDINEVIKELYEFTYDGNTAYTVMDEFGYKSKKPSSDFLSDEETVYLNNFPYPSSPTTCKQGVLKKMKLPGGGCILYDFESNTYSNYTYDPDAKTYSLKEDSDFYSHFPNDCNLYQGNCANDQNYYPLIPENYVESEYLTRSLNKNGQSGSVTFTITDTKDLFFKVSVDPDVVQPNFNNGLLQPTPFNPNITIKGNQSGCTFYNNPYILKPANNYNNKCLGEKITLTPGTYTIYVASTVPVVYTPPIFISAGIVQINQTTQNPNPTKYFYGGGIRVKQIGFFDKDVDANYYNDTATYNNQGIYPVKELSYNYNFFNNKGFSSGYLQLGNLFESGQKIFGGYQNVTVTDSKNNGKTQHTFTHSGENVYIPGEGIDYAKNGGLLIKKEIFDSSNSIISSTDYCYDFIDFSTIMGGFSNEYPLIKSTRNYGNLTQITTKDYFTSGPSSIATIKYFNYNTFGQPVDVLSYSSGGESIKTSTLYYQYLQPLTGHELTANTISRPNITASYRNNELLSTSKINYVNTYPGNLSYLPQTVAFSKGTDGTTTTVIKSRVNKYDKYSRVLEEQPEKGLITSYIYGYNKSQIIAKIENATNDQILTALSKSDMDSITEANMTNIDGLRSGLPNAMITTYTYKPLVGVLTVTDPKGDKISYEYDDLGRLIKVKDKDGNLLSDTEYKYNN